MKQAISIPLLMLLLSAQCAFAQPISNEDIDKVIGASGLGQVIAELPDRFSASFESARNNDGYPLPTEDMDAVRKIVYSAFQAKYVRAQITRAIRQNLTGIDANALLTWYESDLGHKINQLHERARTPEAKQDMQRRAKALLLSESRVQVARQLDTIAGDTNLALQVQDLAMTALYTAFWERTHKQRPLDLERLHTELAESAPSRRARILNAHVLESVYAYRSLNLRKLKEYVAFMESPAAIALYRAVNLGLTNAFDASISQFSRALAEHYKPEPQPGTGHASNS